MKTAQQTNYKLHGFCGHAAHYKLSEPFHSPILPKPCTHVVASSVLAPDTGNPETMIFPADSQGRVLSFGELACVYELSHDAALKQLGYELTP
jgi:hypothetical protein